MRNNNIFSRSCWSTTLQLLNVLDKLKLLPIDTVITIFMDFQKALEKVPHSRLLHKVKKLFLHPQTPSKIDGSIQRKPRIRYLSGTKIML